MRACSRWRRCSQGTIDETSVVYSPAFSTVMLLVSSGGRSWLSIRWRTARSKNWRPAVTSRWMLPP